MGAINANGSRFVTRKGGGNFYTNDQGVTFEGIWIPQGSKGNLGNAGAVNSSVMQANVSAGTSGTRASAGNYVSAKPKRKASGRNTSSSSNSLNIV